VIVDTQVHVGEGVLVHDQEPGRGHLLEFAARLGARLQRGAKALCQRLMGCRLERASRPEAPLWIERMLCPEKCADRP